MSVLTWTILALTLAQGPISPAPSEVSSEELRWRFVPGRTLVYRVVDRQTIADQAPKAPVISNKTTSMLRLRTTSAEEIGSRHVCRFERVQLELGGTSSPTLLDTAQPAKRKDPKEFSLYRELVAHDFTVTMDEQGGILSIAGGPADPATAAASQAHLRRVWSALSSWTPRPTDDPRNPWQRREELPAGLVDLVRQNRVQVTGRDGTQVRLTSEIRLSGKPTKNKSADGETVIASLNASRPGRAQIVFDAQLGAVRSIQSAAAFEMLITRVAGGPMPAAVQSAQKAQAELVIELVSADPSAQAN